MLNFGRTSGENLNFDIFNRVDSEILTRAVCYLNLKQKSSRTDNIFQLLELDEDMNPIRDPETGLCVRGNKGLMVKMRSKYSQINRYVGIAGE